MSKGQITVRLDPEEKVTFENYAAELGLLSSELAKLLVVRERRLERLLALKKRDRIPRFHRQDWGKGIRKPTVTAHFSNPSDVEAFDRYANACGLIRQSAGAWLLITELKERWLEKALSRKVSSRHN